jgi:hypothetical protein
VTYSHPQTLGVMGWASRFNGCPTALPSASLDGMTHRLSPSQTGCNSKCFLVSRTSLVSRTQGESLPLVCWMQLRHVVSPLWAMQEFTVIEMQTSFSRSATVTLTFGRNAQRQRLISQLDPRSHGNTLVSQKRIAVKDAIHPDTERCYGAGLLACELT